ncbi:L,D-transpeptidase ErfK/SrfK [Marinobacter daqiaonensis]|uniref:L,D-transpeptidase ErfK/SrfK n=1 Tax=Marinobacter daqiaonensis TaxID=650891 RepID=A0A1I6IHD3_9GAMM|nr:L,D-transpeptidase family protein [Marinobacter daqiaonensis]SFR66162.1 L,D-transpeptidase ErfK/SrfK [Marinobacter daqiaonensis]
MAISRVLTAGLTASLLLAGTALMPAMAAERAAEGSQAGQGSVVRADESETGASGKDSRARSPVWALKGDLAGNLQVVTTRYEDTFAELGNRLSLGYLELVKANPGVDPWLPGDGNRITLPRQYVLPESRREGIVINLAEYRLYYFRDGGVQVFPVGVGTEENPSPITDAKVTMGLESPAWYPPASIRAEFDARGEYLPRMIPPGPENPLGTHALVLSEEGYLIHGTNKGFGVGMQVSHGCFRMYNQDISRFVHEVAKGTPVQVVHQPVKIGMHEGEVWLEVHRAKEEYPSEEKERLWEQVSEQLARFTDSVKGLEIQRQAVEMAVDQADGIPRRIGEKVTQVASRTEPAKPESATPGVNRSGATQTESAPQQWF